MPRSSSIVTSTAPTGLKPAGVKRVTPAGRAEQIAASAGGLTVTGTAPGAIASAPASTP